MTTSDQPADMDNRYGQDFEEHRAVLFTLAYSMLGSAAEAEDIVQETWLRRQRVREPVRQERALLCRIATRLALNALRSEANRKESYLGPWLPEPVATEADLADDLILAETVSEATLTVLETLSPAERAAFLLVEVFSLPCHRRRPVALSMHPTPPYASWCTVHAPGCKKDEHTDAPTPLPSCGPS